MLTIISCAKMFRKEAQLSQLAQSHDCTQARFAATSQHIAQALRDCPIESLQKQLKIKPPVAELLHEQMQQFDISHGLPALLAYHGVAFKSLAPEEYSPEDWQHAQDELRVCSFLYGLLRPLDAISNYRLEGSFKLGEAKGDTIFNYWKNTLTDSLIADAQAQGGILCMLASKEMQNLFDWKRVNEELTVITPDFLIEEKGKRRVCSVRSKQARGTMASHILRHRWTSAQQIKTFAEDGYILAEESDNKLLFVKNID
ncbi:MAG: YaaA family protein [Akkermansia sp.]